ncbi:hypothetical protein GCM10017621_29950 [Maricaulis virginensis]|uniref:Uncharacterized protein n=1 Tax=Maricaulis virginensis TaxID=144022 RepID=A0A9W6MPS5_9PROT|nr:hypothetical protein GCM10017621_29950 [Maricaulis virginensis]
MKSRSVMGRLGFAGIWINIHSADWIGHSFTAVAMMSMVLSAITTTRVRRCLAFTARTRVFV